MMSCTIFYKGALKEKYSQLDVLHVVTQHVRHMNAEITQSDPSIIIHFLHGKSEPLVLDFKSKSVDGFCKWNGESPEEFYGIFDLFLDLKPLFRSLRIEDDGGLWHEYTLQKGHAKSN